MPPQHPHAVRPAEVETAFKLCITQVVLGLLGAILSFTLVPTLVDQALAQAGGAGIPADQLRAAATVGAISGLVFGIVLIGLFLLFAFMMRNGRNWARIVLTVVGAISVISNLLSVGTYGQLFAMGIVGIISVVLSIIGLVLTIAVIYFMFRPAANQYFKGVRAA